MRGLAGRLLRPSLLPGRLRGQEGSAVVDFVLVSMLVLAAVVALLQLALGLHARNVLIDAAGEGARRAALAGGTPAEAQARVRALSDAALADGYVQSVEVSRARIDGLSIVVVTVTAPLPVLGLLGPGGALRVQGRAVDEMALLEAGQDAAPPGIAGNGGDRAGRPEPAGPVDLEEAARAVGPPAVEPPDAGPPAAPPDGDEEVEADENPDDGAGEHGAGR
ncbi:MAG: TadE/TadG family type IV pilus assembly protein [Actinomyces bowdenii]|nr:TadE/TadG family type IV pilus assembly protein [Actinomyces bowdenii]